MPKKSTKPTTSSAKKENKVSKPTSVERFDQWRRRAGRLHADAVMRMMNDPIARMALYGAFAHTEYLARCCLTHPDAAIKALTGESSKILSEVARDLRALDRVTGPTTALSQGIRPLKERAIVAIGLADLSQNWTYEQVGASLSDLAERTLDAGLSWLTRLAYRHGEFTSPEELAPVPLPGLFVLGGGDLAADEPSYCGPLEILVAYDQDVLAKSKVGATERVFGRIAGELGDAFRTLNKEGSIFEVIHIGQSWPSHEARTGQGGLVLSVEEIYEDLKEGASPAQRAWIAGARVVAGDRKAGGDILEKMSSKIWKKGFTADEIGEVVKLDKRGTKGNDKVGPRSDLDAHARLVQTCRLALGQNHADFRQGHARSVFSAAGKIGALDKLTTERLGSNHDFYSVARNRLHLIRGHASSVQPIKDEANARAALCGYSEAPLFEAVLQGTVSEAEQHWLNIVAEPAELGFDILGNAAASDNREDGEAKDVGKLEDIGFSDGQGIASIVDNWVHGVVERTASEPRQRLSQMAPGLLTEFAGTQNPDLAIVAFDLFLSLLPSEEHPFDRLREDNRLSETVVDFFGNTPRFARVLIKNAELAKDVFNSEAEITQSPEEWLEKFPPPRRHGKDEQVLGALSEWLWECRARLCLSWLRGDLDLNATGSILCGLTEAAVNIVYEICMDELVAADKTVGRGLSVIAMGEFGDGYLSSSSPLDLAFVYDPDSGDGASSDGVRLYTDAATRITEYLTELRPVGGVGDLPLFEIDTRCRPGGTSGEIASSLGVYQTYYVGEADAREQLGLARARVINGPNSLKARIEDMIAELLTRPRHGDQIYKDADKARERDMRLNRTDTIWDVKNIRGGQVDLDMVVQCLQMRHGAEHPYVLTTDAHEALAALTRAGCLDPGAAQELGESLSHWERLQAVKAFTGVADPATDRPNTRLAKVLARAVGVSDFTSIELLIRGHAERTLAHYNHFVLGYAPEMASRRAAAGQ